MTRPSTFVPAKQRTRQSATSKGAADFLRGNDKLASLLPTITRMATLQRDCALALPSMFDACNVLQFDSGQLVLSTPTAALASKLKQQLPKLQAELIQRGWLVSAIRLKVQVGTTTNQLPTPKQLTLPAAAVAALVQLESALESSPKNASLIEAIERFVQRQRS